MKPGIYYDMDRSDYEKIDAVNYSTLKHFNKSPAHVKEEMMHPKEPTRAMEIGNAIHLSILEPDRFKKEYIVTPNFDRRTKEGKEKWIKFEAENFGKVYLTRDEFDKCKKITESIKSKETIFKMLYETGKNETTCVWKDKETGLLCKGRQDRITKFMGWTIVVDIKTTISAQINLFASQTARFNYHLQAAFYLDGLDAIYPIEQRRRYIVLAIEKDSPYEMRLFEFDDEALHEGRQKYKSYLRQYKKCVDSGIWKGYSDNIEPLNLPVWAMGDYELNLGENNEQ